jgi:hypothetical protein
MKASFCVSTEIAHLGAMRLLQTFLLIVSLCSVAFAADLQRLLSEGQTAMIRGDVESAKRAFSMAYQIDPRNPVAVAGLKQIALQQGKGGGSAQVEKQLSALIIPQIQFKDANFASALEALKAKVTEVSGGKQAANFVVKPGVDQNTAVTLSLTNVPVTEALRYLAELANSKVEYEKYAIVIKPAGGASATTTTAPQ